MCERFSEVTRESSANTRQFKTILCRLGWDQERALSSSRRPGCAPGKAPAAEGAAGRSSGSLSRTSGLITNKSSSSAAPAAFS